MTIDDEGADQLFRSGLLDTAGAWRAPGLAPIRRSGLVLPGGRALRSSLSGTFAAAFALVFVAVVGGGAFSLLSRHTPPPPPTAVRHDTSPSSACLPGCLPSPAPPCIVGSPGGVWPCPAPCTVSGVVSPCPTPCSAGTTCPSPSPSRYPTPCSASACPPTPRVTPSPPCDPRQANPVGCTTPSPCPSSTCPTPSPAPLCTSSQVDLTVTTDAQSYSSGQTVNITSTLHNHSTQACSVETVSSNNVGCNNSPYITDSSGRAVWYEYPPSLQACQSPGDANLEPGQSLTHHASWNQQVTCYGQGGGGGGGGGSPGLPPILTSPSPSPTPSASSCSPGQAPAGSYTVQQDWMVTATHGFSIT